jgi:recombination protein RecR
MSWGDCPGIGPKSAQRIAFHILKVSTDDAHRLSDAIVAVKERTTLCERCFNVAEGWSPVLGLQR